MSFRPLTGNAHICTTRARKCAFFRYRPEFNPPDSVSEAEEARPNALSTTPTAPRREARDLTSARWRQRGGASLAAFQPTETAECGGIGIGRQLLLAHGEHRHPFGWRVTLVAGGANRFGIFGLGHRHFRLADQASPPHR